MNRGVTPQQMASWRYTCGVITHAYTGVSERYLASRRAVSPLLVTVRIALALMSMAVVQAACAMAAATLRWFSAGRFTRRFL